MEENTYKKASKIDCVLSNNKKHSINESLLTTDTSNLQVHWWYWGRNSDDQVHTFLTTNLVLKIA